MFCPACRHELPNDAHFCSQCGKTLTASANDRSPAAAVRANPADEPERVIWEGGYSPRAMVGGWLLAAVITVGALALAAVVPPVGVLVLVAAVVVWVVLIARLVFHRLTVHYRLTNHRFIRENGFFDREADPIDLFELEDVKTRQSLFQRLTGTGTIILTPLQTKDSVILVPGAPGKDGKPGQMPTMPTHRDNRIVMPGIADVVSVAQQIDDARRRERRRKGVMLGVGGDVGGFAGDGS